MPPFGDNAALQGLRLIQRDVTSAEILALHSSPIELAPSPGPGRAYAMITNGTAIYRAGATPYTGSSPLAIGPAAAAATPGYPADSCLTAGVPGLINSAADALGSFELTGFGGADLALSEDQPLVLTCDSNPGAGDGTLRVVVYCAIVELP